MKVAVGLLQDAAGRLLVTQRGFESSHGGLWEFPGGKLEPHETPLDALIREFQEEVGITVKQASFWFDVPDPSRDVVLSVFWIHDYAGAPACLAGQLDLRWVSVDGLSAYPFPAPNQLILSQIRFSLLPLAGEGVRRTDEGKSILTLTDTASDNP